MVEWPQPNATKLLWIGDASRAGRSHAASVRGFFVAGRQLAEPSPLQLAEEDIHLASDAAEVFEVLRAYQGRPEYFVYISALDAGGGAAVSFEVPPSLAEVLLEAPRPCTV